MQRGEASPETFERLARNEREIQAATREFADGLSARSGPVPSLEAAAAAMLAAIDALEGKDLSKSVELETSALSNLVLARRDLRQLLKQSDSQKASLCRNFDRQQHQKLRPPEKPPEQKQSVAEVRQQLEQLAKQQRKFSEEVRGGSPQSPEQRQPSQPQPSQSEQQAQSQSQSQAQSQSQSQSPSESQSPTQQSQQSSQPADPQALAARQQAAAEAAAKLRDQLAAEQAGSEVSQQRLDEAAEAIRQSGQEIAAERPGESAEQADRAAEGLDRLSDHLAELNAADLAERLQGASRLARDLAARQQALAERAAKQGEEPSSGEQPSPEAAAQSAGHAREQGELAARGEELAELLDRLAEAAADDESEVADRLSEATAVDPPAEAAALMREAEGQFQQDDGTRGAASARLAGEMLARLAAGLDEAQRQFAQPRLDELLAAEERIAELLAELQQADSPAERELLRGQIEDLLQELQRAAAGNPALQAAVGEALAKTALAQAQGSSEGQSAEREPGLYESGRVLTEALREIASVLQTQIQEAILAGALADPNAAVPPQYQKMVDEYYRVLSEDLRE